MDYPFWFDLPHPSKDSIKSNKRKRHEDLLTKTLTNYHKKLKVHKIKNTKYKKIKYN